MKVKFDYKNGTPSFEKMIPRCKGWDAPIINVEVEGRDSRQRQSAVNDYILSMIYTLRGLKNMHETEITNFEFEGNLIATISTNAELQNSVRAFSFPYDFILYTVYQDFFNESLYLTRGASEVDRKGKKIFVEKITNKGDDVDVAKLMQSSNSPYVLNKDIFNEKFDEKQMREFMGKLNVLIARYYPEYAYKRDGENLYLTYKGARIDSIEDIPDDEAFLFFKLFEVTIHRKNCIGVFFIDCNIISAKLISAIVGIINLFFKTNRLVFLYNLTPAKRKELRDFNCELILLPNHLAKPKANSGKGKKKK